MNVNIYLRSSNNISKDPKFVAKYFMARPVNDSRVANCEVQCHDFTVKINKEEINLKIPMCVNTCKLIKGVEILLLSAADGLVSPVEPAKRIKKNN
jgi:hypothetical protein